MRLPVFTTRSKAPDTARHIKRVTHPLFRALTKDDFQAPVAESVPKDGSIGFKAWYGIHDSHRTKNNVPGMQQKAIVQHPSIESCNQERTKNTARRDCDAPHFEMSVLDSKRKRTMGELGYNELIAPAQIESPSEKLLRMAKKRRQRQGRCDFMSQKTDTRDAQSLMCFEYVYGYEDDMIIRESVGLALSPTVYESLDKQESLARVRTERNEPSVVRELSTEGHSARLITQPGENLRDGLQHSFNTDYRPRLRRPGA